jgi:hypothetical protein
MIHCEIPKEDTKFTVVSDDIVRWGNNLDNIRSDIVKICANKELVNVDTLEHVQDVSLTACTNLTDISGLRHAKRVTLFACPKLKDVSALKDAEYVDISACPVSDVSALANVPTLIVKDCAMQTVNRRLN